MRRKIGVSLLSKFLIGIMLAVSVMSYMPITVSAEDVALTANELAFKAVKGNYESYINGTPVGVQWGSITAYDGYVLSKAGVDISQWNYEDESLKAKLLQLMDTAIADEGSDNKIDTKYIAQDYLAAVQLNETTRADALMQILVNRQTVDGMFETGTYGIYSNMSSYEMLSRDNGLIHSGLNLDACLNYIISSQDTTGAWPVADPDQWITNDFMTTAEAVRVLYALKDKTTVSADNVEAAIKKALDWLESCQQEDGGFVTGYDDKVVDTAEFILTAKAIGVEPDSVETNGKTAIDYLFNTALGSGDFGSLSGRTWVLDTFLELGANLPSSGHLDIHVDVPETLYLGESTTCSALYINISGKEKINTSGTWKSSNEAVAAIDEYGSIQGASLGSTMISLTVGDLFDEVQFDVIPRDKDALMLLGIQNHYQSYASGVAIDGAWGHFSSYDYYIMEETGVETSQWDVSGQKMKTSVVRLIDETLANENGDAKASAKRVAQDYLGALALSEDAKASALLDILELRQDKDGNLDKGSYAIYSNMAAYDLLARGGSLVSSDLNLDNTVAYILNSQDTTGAWPVADPDQWITNDFVTTAEAVRILEALKGHSAYADSVIDTAIDKGLSWLKENQQDNGGFQIGYDDLTVDTSEMIYTLKVLDEDIETVVSGTSLSAIDYMLESALNDGSFGNVASTTWAIDGYKQLGGHISQEEAVAVHVLPNEYTLKVGNYHPFNATVLLANGNESTVTNKARWSTSDVSLGAVDEKGILTALKKGSFKLYAEYDGISALGSIVVNNKSDGDNDDKSDEINVWVAVIGEDDTLLYGPRYVKVSEDDIYGKTAMGTLDATGLNWSVSDEFDGFVDEIAGDKNVGMYGWMYSVNGKVPSVLSNEKVVKSYDKVLWWYSDKSLSEQPDWPSDNSSSSGSTMKTQDKDTIKKTLYAYKDMIGSQSLLLNQDSAMKESERQDLKKELEKNVVDLSKVFDKDEIVISDIEVSLLVPQNALSSETTVTISELSSNEAPKQFGVSLASSVYAFGPDHTDFAEPVIISIQVAIDETMDLSRLTPAWYNRETGQWEEIPSVIDLKNQTVTFTIDHFTEFGIIEKAERKSFADVSENYSWAKDAIEVLAGQGVITGSDKGFEPERSITRAEFVKLAVEAFGITKEQAKGNIFSDVSKEAWYSAYVEAANAYNLVEGDETGAFRPNDPISRNEIAVIISRMAKDKSEINKISDEDTLIFSDAKAIPMWALKSVKYVNEKKIMNGYKGMFNGELAITRAEAAVVVYRYLNLKED